MLNHITIMGRLVNAPELRVTQSGTKVASLRIACDRDYAADGAEKQCDFIDCVAWRATGEFICRNFTKGQPILIEGRLQMRDWTDKEGNKRRTYEINVSNAHFAGGKREDKPTASPQLVDISDDDGDLPWDTDGEL